LSNKVVVSKRVVSIPILAVDKLGKTASAVALGLFYLTVVDFEQYLCRLVTVLNSVRCVFLLARGSEATKKRSISTGFSTRRVRDLCLFNKI
jgi:hypothetical protein